MRFYITSQRIQPSRIFVLHFEANPALFPCFSRLPPSNVIHVPRSARITEEWLASRPPPPPPSPAPPRSHSDGHRMSSVMAMQRVLLSRFSHTLIVDMDELVMADPREYASLHQYLHRNPQRLTAAPGNAYEVQMVAPDESTLDWSRVPLLRGQRGLMVPTCGMRKPILSRVPTRFTFSTHHMRDPLFFACSPDRYGSAANCLENKLWLVHTKPDLTFTNRYPGASLGLLAQYSDMLI
ncbi:MAG: hypothetical protein SGPRY_008057 [Prymnesium sp.]